MTIPGVNTHNAGWVDPAELRDLFAMGYRYARIAAADDATDAVTLEMVTDAKTAGFNLVLMLTDPERIRLVAPLFTEGDLVECRNEDDGDLTPRTYRRILDEFCRIGLELGVAIGGPTCSNTNRKCVEWASRVRGAQWPAGMSYLTWHSYDPHENTRFAEMEQLADGMPIVISEFGYPSMGQTVDAEVEQAEKATQLWARYDKYHAAIWFQIHDGDNPNEREHCYGLQSVDKTWKPVAYTVPTPNQETNVIAEPMISRSQLMPVASRPGYYTVRYPRGSTETVLSIQPDGEWQTRPIGTEGAWEVSRIEGTRLVFPETEVINRGIALGD